MISYEIPKKRLPPGADVKIDDTTIRDGWQMPGIHMTPEQKVRIYEYLHLIGVDKMECFLYTPTDKRIALAMLEKGYSRPEVTGWARANIQDIDEVASVPGIKEVGILMSVSDIHIFKKMSLASREEAEAKYLQALEHSLDKGLRVRCHLEDLSRAEFDAFVVPLVAKMIERCPDVIIRVCDTVGIALPDPGIPPPRGTPQTIIRLKQLGVKEIETHMHDDFGNSLGNSLVGFDCGANWTSVTFLGIGERAGNTELEKVLINVKYMEGFENKYRLDCLNEFAEYMEKEVGIFVPRNKAIVGKNVFTHESGIHAGAVTKDPVIYEPFPPSLVGGRRRLVVGPTSGTEIIAYRANEILQDMGSAVRVNKRDASVAAILEEIREIYSSGTRKVEASISYDEMKRMVEKYVPLEEPMA